MTEDFKALIGSCVKTISINEDRNLILFDSEDALFVFGTWGDCCAYLVFEDIEYPSKKPKHGWRINKVEEVGAYGYRLQTLEGDIIISCRYECGSGYGGYGTGVELYSYQWKSVFKKEIKWVGFKEVGSE